MILTSNATPSTRTGDRIKRQRHWWTSALAGALFLATPLVVFLRYQSYSLFEAEALVCLALLAMAGALVGLALEVCGSWSRALMYALLITLMVDIQSDTPERFRLLWGVLGVSTVAMILLRKALPRYGPPL